MAASDFHVKPEGLALLKEFCPDFPDHIPFTNFHLAHQAKVLASRVLYFHCNLTQERIADQLGIGHASVSKYTSGKYSLESSGGRPPDLSLQEEEAIYEYDKASRGVLYYKDLQRIADNYTKPITLTRTSMGRRSTGNILRE